MDDYVVYLNDLADELGCELRLAPDLAGMMYVEFGYVEGPDPDTSIHHTPQQAFAVGLHELGHFFHGHTQGRPPMGHLTHYFDNGVLRSEAEAWEYALDKFAEREEEIAQTTRDYMWGRCMRSYYSSAVFAGGRGGQRLWNGNRHHVPFTYDEPDEFFWSIKDRITQVPVAA